MKLEELKEYLEVQDADGDGYEAALVYPALDAAVAEIAALRATIERCQAIIQHWHWAEAQDLALKIGAGGDATMLFHCREELKLALDPPAGSQFDCRM